MINGQSALASNQIQEFDNQVGLLSKPMKPELEVEIIDSLSLNVTSICPIQCSAHKVYEALKFHMDEIVSCRSGKRRVENVHSEQLGSLWVRERNWIASPEIPIFLKKLIPHTMTWTENSSWADESLTANFSIKGSFYEAKGTLRLHSGKPNQTNMEVNETKTCRISGAYLF